MALQNYITDTAYLLRDSNHLMVPLPQLQRSINHARYQIALRTGCIRVLAYGQSPFGGSAQPGTMIPGAAIPGSPPTCSFQTIPGVEKYPFTYANQFVTAQNAGVKGIIDIFNLSVSWGGIRPSLRWLPWDELQAYGRSYNLGAFSYPFLWATYGRGSAGSFWLFPVPQIPPIPSPNQTQGYAGEIEADCTAVPLSLYTDSDFEALPEPFANGVKYYAAAISMQQLQRYGSAKIYFDMFNEHLDTDNIASDGGHVTDYYDVYNLP